MGKRYHSLRERAMLEFQYSTGCRIGEVVKIDSEDLKWENCSAIATTLLYVQLRGERRRELYRVINKLYLSIGISLCIWNEAASSNIKCEVRKES
ncbi:hypothetical protein EJP77_02065 [Paenibacillus zeisoli]|uniref:Tyr recombinase domain-containing protein n=1 Tax=Paenibacillus zeisoli TaxID=2496267 RepID=A0A3S1BAN3_9BACL|nr:hypothetical protein EJP77_02065 [Paenibacillus zeisoli]